jgi:transposase
MSKRLRRKHPSSLKAALLKKHHVEKVPVSDVCDEAEVQPSLFYIWQRQLFETAKTALDGGRKGASGQEKALAARVAELEAQLAEKDAVIAKKDAVIAENSEEFVKVRNAWGALKGRWVPHDTRDEVVDFVRAWSAKDRDRGGPVHPREHAVARSEYEGHHLPNAMAAVGSRAERPVAINSPRPSRSR